MAFGSRFVNSRSASIVLAGRVFFPPVGGPGIRGAVEKRSKRISIGAILNLVDIPLLSRRIGDCLLFFQLAWEYLLFDNRVKQARTRLVSRLLVRVYRIRGQ
jgi:hypothetical protein